MADSSYHKGLCGKDTEAYLTDVEVDVLALDVRAVRAEVAAHENLQGRREAQGEGQS